MPKSGPFKNEGIHEASISFSAISLYLANRRNRGFLSKVGIDPPKQNAAKQTCAVSFGAQPIHDEKWRVVDQAEYDREQGDLRDVERPRRHVIQQRGVRGLHAEIPKLVSSTEFAAIAATT